MDMIDSFLIFMMGLAVGLLIMQFLFRREIKKLLDEIKRMGAWE